MPSRTAGPILKTLLFVVFVPGAVLLFIPDMLLARPMPQPAGWLNWLALGPGALGAVILLICAWDFAVVGLGTPAPIDPPKALVVSGLYRFVRNPMYVGVALALFSESLLFSSVKILIYALLVVAAFNIFVSTYEEPALKKQFGDSYELYCQGVPRWIPRFTPSRPKT